MPSTKSRLISSHFLALLLIFLLSAPAAYGALTAVSTDGTGATLINIANGFPLWYDDGTNKLELCLEQEVIDQADGVSPFRPCLTAEANVTRPISFPNNFGAEAFYYLLEAADTFTDSDGTVGSLLLAMALEAAFTAELTIDGTQTVFNRTRIRAEVPIAGTYRVTHPLGTVDYVVPVAGPGLRSINQTQDVGDFLVPVDFTVALNDGPAPAPGGPADPAINEGVVNQDGLGLTDFLAPPAAPPVVDTRGNMYLAAAGTELNPVLNPVEPGVDGVDFFSIELIELADGALPDPVTGAFLGAGAGGSDYFLNATAGSQTILLDTFLVSGKIFNEGNNLSPMAAPDTAATSPDIPVLIDVQPNDVDVSDLDPADPTSSAANNVHGLNEQAVGIVEEGNILITATHTTPQGASVRRITDLPTGKSLFLYTPPAGFAGEDSFDYIIQDTGGLLSTPTTVSVTVENIQTTRAEFRPRTGKWTIEGASTDGSANAITATTGPRAFLNGSAMVPAPVTTDAEAVAALRVDNDSIAYQVDFGTLPLSEVTEITLHVGGPTDSGPMIFSLYDSLFDPPIAGPVSGTLGALGLNLRPTAGVNNLADAIQEILAGNTYLTIQTLDNPTGEIRGQLEGELIGTATVQVNGRWKIETRSRTLPAGALPSVNLFSANGVAAPGIPLQLR